jgi:hypothetical protein
MILMGKRASISGSGLASNAEIRSMLLFCAKNNITAMIEERDMTPDGANSALAKVEANTARYRMVLVNRSKIPATTTTTTIASAPASPATTSSSSKEKVDPPLDAATS